MLLKLRIRKIVFVLLIGLASCGVMSGQTAPQLLPYTVKLIAGGGSATIASGGTCPTSGYTSTDAYGDGCLATEIELGNVAVGGSKPGARRAVADASGNVFFADYNNGLVRRVDAQTGIVTAVAGGASASPTSGTACGSYTSTDALGDGCLGTAVKLKYPVALVFAPNGDLYFSDAGYANVRKIAATSGVIPSTGGVISLVAGNVSGAYGYTSNNGSTTIKAATQSYLDYPTGLAVDANGNLYISDYYKEAVLVVNTGTSSVTVAGVTIPAGTIAKIAGAYNTATPTSTCPNYVSSSSTGGCNYLGYTTSTFPSNGQANITFTDYPYDVTVDGSGNVYFPNEYTNHVVEVDTTGVINNYAGTPGTASKTLQRGTAGGFSIGSPFGVAADSGNNLYIGDASSGVIWRVDATSKLMYVVAGNSSSSICSGASDSYGDGCPATQAIFGHSGSGNYATTTLPGPGVYGVSVDKYSNLYVGDTEYNLIREISSGTQFGYIGNNEPTQTADIHFAAGDGPSSSVPFELTSGSANFTLGTPSCTLNSDNTKDCLLPITATPATLGAFSGVLTVTSSYGATAEFPLNGTFVMSPYTRTSVAVTSTTTSCSATTVYGTQTPLTLTATVNATGTPTGYVTFYANGMSIGKSAVSGSTATLTYTFSTAGAYAITATYGGDSYYYTSTSSGTTITSSTPTFTVSLGSYAESSVYAGGTALYTLNLAQSVYSGTITFSCTGLPANAACVFSPASITASGCSTTNTTAVSITTTQGNAVLPAALGGGRSLSEILLALLSLTLAAWVRRRRQAARCFLAFVAVLLLGTAIIGCNSSLNTSSRTPAGTYTVTVTATGSTGTTASTTLPLTVK